MVTHTVYAQRLGVIYQELHSRATDLSICKRLLINYGQYKYNDIFEIRFSNTAKSTDFPISLDQNNFQISAITFPTSVHHNISRYRKSFYWPISVHIGFEVYCSHCIHHNMEQDVQRTTAPSAGPDQKMGTLAERGHFNQGSASRYHASCHRISDCNMICSHFVIWVIIPRTWSNLIVENFKVPWNAQNWLSTAILNGNLHHGHDETSPARIFH